MTGGKGEDVNVEELDKLAERLGSTLGPLFETGTKQLEDAEISGASFSTYGVGLQAVYPTAQAFAMRDLQTKSQNVASIIERLGKVAGTWRSAEDASTTKKG